MVLKPWRRIKVTMFSFILRTKIFQKNITYLSISNTLSIANKRMEGYCKALTDHRMETKENGVVFCTNNEAYNYNAIKNLMSNKDHPDGLIASVEKLTITVYHVCNNLNLQIPQDVKVISFSNLSSALILNPSLTTITQPAFEMGEAAASLLFNALEKRNFILKGENIILPSVLNIRNSTK